MALNIQNDTEWAAVQSLLANMRQRDGLVPLSVVTGSLAGMTDAEAVDALWDALRIQACSTGTKAHRIVMLHKHDLENAIRRIKPENKDVITNGPK